VIWQIDSFDQWGVGLGKALAMRILPELAAEAALRRTHDSFRDSGGGCLEKPGLSPRHGCGATGSLDGSLGSTSLRLPR
jgi:hypothetical protein